MNLHLKSHFAYILDDHTLFGDALAKTMEEYIEFKGIFSFTNDKDLINKLLHHKTDFPSYLFLDYYLGEKPLPTILSEIKRIAKHSKIIIVTGMDNPMLLKDLLTYNPDGLVHKAERIEEIITCVYEVSKGRNYLTPYIENIIENYRFTSERIPFSPREIELISCFNKGLTVTETAEALNISHHTVSSHRKKMFKKINCSNLAELLAFARRLNII